jgi:hypothetical protein
MARFCGVLVLGLVCAAGGCNGDGDGDGEGGAGSCGPTMACGGDVVGEWTVQDACIDADDLFQTELSEPECADVIRGVDVSATGTYTFAADGNGSSEITLNLDVDALWSEACLSALADGASIDLEASCTNIERNYLESQEFSGAACNVEGNACACLATAVPRTIQGAGRYRVEGDQLINEENGDADLFCVEGETLTIWTTDGETRGTLTLMR